MNVFRVSVALCVLDIAMTGCGGSAVQPPEATAQAVTSCGIPIDPTRSLFVTDPTTLQEFPLESVLKQIVSTGSTGQTALGLYQQMLDTLHNKATGVTNGPHCDDETVHGLAAINGFQEQFCPRQEGELAKTNPFVAGNPDSYIPVGVVNRFDLAPKAGQNCGEYRIVYGKLSGQTQPLNRMFLIFEGVLPNPNPSAGLPACLPVAQFWADLSRDASASNRAAKLKSFYFEGLSGTTKTTAFLPVIQARNYGIGGGTNTGQIRANMFMAADMGQEWELREFRLSQECNGSACSLTAHNTPVQNNPFGPLFHGVDATSVAFQREFLGQVSSLAAKTLSGIAMKTPMVDDGPQSDEGFPSNNDYFSDGVGAALFDNIGAKLASIGRMDLTAQDIVNRATTQSCAGCHQISTNQDVGPSHGSHPDLVWPLSLAFTHVDEFSHLSPALTDVFLPARATVLESFIQAHCGGALGDTGNDLSIDDGMTVGGSAVGAAN